MQVNKKHEMLRITKVREFTTWHDYFMFDIIYFVDYC